MPKRPPTSLSSPTGIERPCFAPRRPVPRDFARDSRSNSPTTSFGRRRSVRRFLHWYWHLSRATAPTPTTKPYEAARAVRDRFGHQSDRYGDQLSEPAFGARHRRGDPTASSPPGVAIQRRARGLLQGRIYPVRSAPRQRPARSTSIRSSRVPRPQILQPDEIVGGGHSLAPRFSATASRRAARTSGSARSTCLPPQPWSATGGVSRPELQNRLRAAFGLLEEAAARGEIGVYGCATWDELRVPPEDERPSASRAAVELAREVAGKDHHFRADSDADQPGDAGGRAKSTQTLVPKAER